MRCRSSSPIAWKMPPHPPCSTIQSAVSAAFSSVTGELAALGDLREVFAGERRIELTVRHRDVLRVAAAALVADDGRAFGLDLRARRRIFQPLQRRLASALLRPRRQQRRADARRRCGVRILIDGGVDAARPRFVDHPQRFHRAAPVRLADHLVMRDLRRQPAFFADGNRLAHALDAAPWLRRACGRCRCRPSGRRRARARSLPRSA